MKFSDFDKIMHSGIGGKKKPKEFTYELLSNIVDFGEEEDLLTDLSDELLRKLYSGGRSIKSTAKAILPYLDTNKFANYLSNACQDGAVDHIITRLAEKGVLTCQSDFVDDVTELFRNILIDSTKTSRAVAETEDTSDDSQIRKYLAYIREVFYSTKTLLYTTTPRPINDFYVPNDLYDPQSRQGSVFNPLARYGKQRVPAAEALLYPKKNFIVITGTGGLGKTMLMRYLVLMMVKNYTVSKKIPVVITLRDFNNSCTDLADFIVRHVPMLDVSGYMEKGNCVFLLDGMDEIKSSYLKTFEKQLSDMAAKYPKNTFIMSSRPISSFIALSKFTVYELAPFTKEQALEMIDKAVYCPETPELKENFRKQLADRLFEDHQDFAENPLLLTIMLMTYERYARIPAKRYVFYREAFDTLVEKHDATKVGYSRLYQTHLFPEEFVKVLEEFCTATYFNEEYELADDRFDEVFSKMEVLADLPKKFTCRDLKKDLTANLCLLYYDGGKYKYIHRSFQEYFCALYLSKAFDDDYEDVWKFFEKVNRKTKEDFTFDMLYDMSPSRVERLIFIPFLEDLFARCKADDPMEEYWNFLEIIYPTIYYTDGDVHYSYSNEPTSYIYETIVKRLNVWHEFLTEEFDYEERFVIERYLCVEKDGKEMIIVAGDLDEYEYYDSVEECGYNCAFQVNKVRHEHGDIHEALESSSSVFRAEYIQVRKFLEDMKERSKIRPRRKWVNL